MATARPPISAPQVAAATMTAEHGFYRVVDGQRDDLRLLRERWPDRTAPECLEAIARLRRRAAPGGDAEAAMEAIFDAYGGPPLVPEDVRQRLERYVEAQFVRAPWPARDLSEDLDEPAIVRKARRGQPGGRTHS